MSNKLLRLLFLDRYLIFWIFVVMVFGILFGWGVLLLLVGFVSLFVGIILILIVIGLIVMMYLLFVKVNYKELGKVFKNLKVFGLLLV